MEIRQQPEEFKNSLDLQALQYGKSWKKMLKRPDRTITAMDGCFYFLDLLDGDYALTISLPNAATRYGVASSEPIQVDSKKGQINLSNIKLTASAIKWQLADSKNGPVSRVKVSVYDSYEREFKINSS